jgi:hypothetical protein
MQEMLRKNGLDAFLTECSGLTGSGDRDAWRAHVITLFRVLTLGGSNRRDDHDPS